MIGETISHFKIEEKLGEGGMGVVYKAQDTKLDRPVALKFISSDSTPSEEEKERFLQEARSVAKLSHPNICNIHSIGEHEGQQFIEMEYIEGETLRNKINESGRVDLDLFRDYAIQLAEALAAAHEKGIIHRDIKPENIMVDNNGRVKIMDFGLAKLKGMQHYTKTGSTVGTLTYMSPEQIQSNDVDARSDIFSLGIVFYEMLTGVHPFEAEYKQALMFKLLNDDPELPSSLHDDIPLELEDLVVRCLQKDREKRYHSVEDIRLELKGEKQWPIQQQDETKFKTDWSRLVSNVGRFGRRNLVSITSIALLVILLGIFWIDLPSFMGETNEQIPDNKHIAVLPFNNLSPQDIPQSLNDGMMEILTSKITQMEMQEGSLWVVPSSEVRADGVNSVKEATRKLGANLAVTGSLQHVGDQLRLTINLVDGNTRRQLRSEMLEIEWGNHIRLQDEVVHKLTNMLEIEMEPQDVQSMTAGGTQNSRVYQLYIEGRGYLSRRDLEGYNRAIELFKKTIEEDSGYVRGYAALAETYWRKYDKTHDTQWTEKALKYGQEAIELMDEQIPEVYITMALINNGMERYKEALGMLGELGEQKSISYQALIEEAKAYEGLGEPEKAEDFYQKAIERRKDYWGGYNSLGKFYLKQERFEEAVETYLKVTELAPERVGGFTNLGNAYFGLRKVDKALDAFHKSLEIRPNYEALTNLGIFYFYKKDYQEAIRMYEQALDLNDTDRRIWGDLGYAYYWSGSDSAKVRKAMKKAIELAKQELEVTPKNQVLLGELAGYHLAMGNSKKSRKLLQRVISLGKMNSEKRRTIIHLYERLGERESALEWVEKSLSQGDDLATLKTLEGTNKLFDDPRFKELQKKYQQ